MKKDEIPAVDINELAGVEGDGRSFCPPAGEQMVSIPARDLAKMLAAVVKKPVAQEPDITVGARPMATEGSFDPGQPAHRRLEQLPRDNGGGVVHEKGSVPYFGEPSTPGKPRYQPLEGDC